MTTVRAFAGARAALGWGSAPLDSIGDVDTVEALTAQLATSFPAAAPVLARCSVLIDGERAASTAALTGATTIDLLPPFAGG